MDAATPPTPPGRPAYANRDKLLLLIWVVLQGKPVLPPTYPRSYIRHHTHKHINHTGRGYHCRWGIMKRAKTEGLCTPPPLSFPTPGKTVPHHPLGDGCQVTPPPPPLGDRTTTVHAHLQAQKLQHGEAPNRRMVVQDGLAIMVIRDAAICITVLRMSNDLQQNRFLRGADKHHICPRGKHGCVVKFHFSESEQNVLP